MVELGRRWAEGVLGVRHEHFATERLRDFLVGQWRPLSDSAGGSTLICATPAGEAHVLGLHMAAFALALHDARIVFLGASVPAREIAQAVEHHAAAAVVLSAATGLDRSALQREMTELRAASDMEFTTGNGRIEVTVPAEFNADIDASTGNGGIRTDFPIQVSGRISKTRLRGTIGQGGRRLRLVTGNGEIEIRKG